MISAALGRSAAGRRASKRCNLRCAGAEHSRAACLQALQFRAAPVLIPVLLAVLLQVRGHMTAARLLTQHGLTTTVR